MVFTELLSVREIGIFQSVDILLSDKKKVEIIKQIQQTNSVENQIVYFGDGLTDKYAFEYVHNIGGNNVFIATNEHSKSSFEKLNTNGTINKYFDADFGEGSPVNNYIQALVTHKRYEHEL